MRWHEKHMTTLNLGSVHLITITTEGIFDISMHYSYSQLRMVSYFTHPCQYDVITFCGSLKTLVTMLSAPLL